jgi:hypothetical protein
MEIQLFSQHIQKTINTTYSIESYQPGITMSIHKASKDLRYLLNHGYKKSYAVKFVSNHYQLPKKERHFLARSIFSDKDIQIALQKKLPIQQITGKEVVVDGFNVLITTEAVLKNEAIFCDDSVLRDTQGIFGKYKITKTTEKALNKIFAVLENYQPAQVTFYFDKQVSHSGDLCSKVRPQFPCETTNHVDLLLSNLNIITATSDSILIQKLDHFIDIPFQISLSKPL